jgi:hypothetical protein
MVVAKPGVVAVIAVIGSLIGCTSCGSADQRAKIRMATTASFTAVTGVEG